MASCFSSSQSQLPPRRSLRCGSDLMRGRIGFPHGMMGRSGNHEKRKLVSAGKCCVDGRGGGGALSGSSTLVEAMREAHPYLMAHRGSTFVVALSSEIIDGPYFFSFLENYEPPSRKRHGGGTTES